MRWFGWLRRKRETDGITELDGSPAVMMGGRMRTAGVPYMLPRDMEEINRLDFQHYLLRYAFRGNYAAPIGHPTSILDVGCGTGRWARELASTFPQARVTGLDVTPPHADEAASADATLGLRPPNYVFTAGNVLEGLPFPDATFDFTHMRLLFLAIPADRWPFVVSELARVTRPGGWVELVEAGGERQGGPAVDALIDWGTRMCAHRGIDVTYGARLGDLLSGTGMVHVQAREVALPLGHYGGRVGTMMEADFFTGIRGMQGLITTLGITSADEFARTLAQAQADVNTPQYKCIAPFYIAYGQRAR
ncbi:MAG: Methyltransferase type 11 [Ktedonobacterales bacterium]|jgi:ubiquinone/menaquinone biosynthesis C-methylase UbiE|nr:MAG: Methyltransferase type 11 [Ktedonobacterales bacterium]